MFRPLENEVTVALYLSTALLIKLNPHPSFLVSSKYIILLLLFVSDFTMYARAVAAAVITTCKKAQHL